MHIDGLNFEFEASPPRSNLSEFAWRTSNRLTHLIAIGYGRSGPLLPVAEHPRSGATWVAHMLSDYLQIPFPKYCRVPLACAAIVHTHLWHSPRLGKAVFVARDGRDLVVSSYFHALKERDRLLAVGQHRHRHIQRYPSLHGATTAWADCRRRLPHFIQDWWRRPMGCQYNWGDYTTAWTRNAPNVVVTTYEALRTDCVAEMARLIELLAYRSINMDRLTATVKKFSFEAQTGRLAGQQDATSNKRKGQVGDWRNYFTRAAAIEFQSIAGHLLIQLGYEPDDSWAAMPLSATFDEVAARQVAGAALSESTLSF